MKIKKIGHDGEGNGSMGPAHSRDPPLINVLNTNGVGSTNSEVFALYQITVIYRVAIILTGVQCRQKILFGYT